MLDGGKKTRTQPVGCVLDCFAFTRRYLDRSRQSVPIFPPAPDVPQPELPQSRYPTQLAQFFPIVAALDSAVPLLLRPADDSFSTLLVRIYERPS